MRDSLGLLMLGLILLTVEVGWAQTKHMPLAIQGRDYQFALPVTGGEGDLSWSLQGEAPPGLQFSGGVLSGIPQRVGNWAMDITVCDQMQAEASARWSIEIVSGPPPPPVIKMATDLPSAVLGHPYKAHLCVEGGRPPYHWTVSSGQLPGWLSLTQDGTLEGMAGSLDALGKAVFSLQVTDGDNVPAPAVAFTLRVSDVVAPLQVLTRVLPIGFTNYEYEVTLSVSGGIPPYQATCLTPEAERCPGLTYEADGRIHGKPGITGNYRLTFRLEDNVGRRLLSDSVVELRILEVPSKPLTLSKLPALLVTENQAFEVELPISGGVAPYTVDLEDRSRSEAFSYDSGLNTIRALGMPAGVYSLQVTVTDSSQPSPQSVTNEFQVTVLAASDLSRNIRWGLWGGTTAILMVLLIFVSLAWRTATRRFRALRGGSRTRRE